MNVWTTCFLSVFAQLLHSYYRITYPFVRWLVSPMPHTMCRAPPSAVRIVFGKGYRHPHTSPRNYMQKNRLVSESVQSRICAGEPACRILQPTNEYILTQDTHTSIVLHCARWAIERTMSARICICLHCNNNIVHQINAFLVFASAVPPFKSNSDMHQTGCYRSARSIPSLHSVNMHALIWKLNYVHSNAKHQHNVFHRCNLSIDHFACSLFGLTECSTAGTIHHMLKSYFLRFDMCHLPQCQFGNFPGSCTKDIERDTGETEEERGIQLWCSHWKPQIGMNH